MPEKKYEDALKELESIVQQLERGDIPLEESLKLFEKGVKLSRFCAKKLDEAEKKVEVLMKDKEGIFKLQSFDTKEEEG
ncbi:MAG: exodeoxyribonuclease VII small subunit [Thermodesulfobacteriota bacterium]|nr:exodeoxyribonuclease VII small subunit [Thermodesulfobacteriota bacterium]